MSLQVGGDGRTEVLPDVAVLATRPGRDPADVEVKAFAGAVVGPRRRSVALAVEP